MPDTLLVPCVPLFDFGDDDDEPSVAPPPPLLLAVMDFQGLLADTLLPKMLLAGVRQGHWEPPKLGSVRARVLVQYYL